jgi:hypothetical protein
MAGDWLKFDKTTPDKPEVFVIAGALGIDPDAVVGKLLRVWSWFDSHTDDGNAPVTVASLLDRLAGVAGFVEATIAAGWLDQRDGQLLIPNFTRHNGQTAKTRALGKNRAAVHRTESNARSNAKSNDPGVTNALPEKRREEKIETPIAPTEESPSADGSGGGDGKQRCLPAGWSKMTTKQRGRCRVLMNTPLMERIGEFVGQKPTTLWTVANTVALKEVAPPDDEVEIVEEYYLAELSGEEPDYRRRGLQALLNNWSEEVTRARHWKVKQP